jgi:hypothetical protein
VALVVSAMILNPFEARVGEVIDEGQNENRMFIAFPIERNSGMDSGGLAAPTAFVVLADGACFLCQ